MATPPPKLDPAFLHRQYEPLRRHLHSQRGAAGTIRRGGHHGGAGRGAISSEQSVGCSRNGEWEVVFVDVRIRGLGGRLSWIFYEHGTYGQGSDWRWEYLGFVG